MDNTGINIYKTFRRNNLVVWGVIGFSLIVCLGALFFAFVVYSKSISNTYAITETGLLVPLKRLDEKKDRLKQVKANLDYFVSLYYDLDSYTMKEKKEKLLWLLGKQPTEAMLYRDSKGYFNRFLTNNGIVQHAQINQATWKWSSIDAPYTLSFQVVGVIINGENKNFFKSNVKVQLSNVNRNYPFNPYGLLITSFNEDFSEMEESEVYKIEKNNRKLLNQND